MRILFKWENCHTFHNERAYILELLREEMTEEIMNILPENDVALLRSGEYFKNNNSWLENRFVNPNPTCTHYNCVYLLVNQDTTKAKLRNIIFPYASLWNDSCPLEDFYGTEIMRLSELNNYSDLIFKMSIRHFSIARKLFKELKSQELFNGNDNHIGDIGEYYVLKYFEKENIKVKLAPNKISDYDLIADNKKVSVKTTTTWAKEGRKTGKLDLLNKKWDILFAVSLNENLSKRKMVKITYEELIIMPEISKNINKIKNGKLKSKKTPFKWWDWLNNDKFLC